jgi:diguanylate cyclase (GGDEF)-like protein/PAS domain S-box-containing protein
MVICDSDRKVIWTNTGFERLSGYALDEVKGRSLTSLLQGSDTDLNTVMDIKEALNNKKSISTEILNYTKSGRAYWNKLIITPLLKNGKVINFVGVQHDITEQVSAKQQLLALNAKLEQRVKDRTSALNLTVQKLKKQADTDPLTGAYNRRVLYRYFESFKENKRQGDKSLWLCVLDIDHFKKINDEHGHDCGDRVLIQITNIIQEQIRDADRLFRIGGEEFVIALESISKANAYHFVARLHSIIRATEFNQEIEKLKVTVSIGMHLVQAEESIDRSLVCADKLLYEAKQNGRDRIVVR